MHNQNPHENFGISPELQREAEANKTFNEAIRNKETVRSALEEYAIRALNELDTEEKYEVKVTLKEATPRDEDEEPSILRKYSSENSDATDHNFEISLFKKGDKKPIEERFEWYADTLENVKEQRVKRMVRDMIEKQK